MKTWKFGDPAVLVTLEDRRSFIVSPTGGITWPDPTYWDWRVVVGATPDGSAAKLKRGEIHVGWRLHVTFPDEVVVRGKKRKTTRTVSAGPVVSIEEYR